MTAVHIHAPEPTRVLRRIHDCRQCRRRRVHAVLCFEWYEPIATCTACGRDWVRNGHVRKRPDVAAARRAKAALMTAKGGG